MTSSVFDTEKFQRYNKALHHIYNKFKKGEIPAIHKTCTEYKINSNLGRILRENRILSPMDGTPTRWVYRNPETNTDEVTNKTVQLVIDKLREMNNSYAKKAKDKKKKEKTITQAIIKKEECSYHSIEHQLVFVTGQLDKEKQIKGYLRSEEVNFLKSIKVNLEKLKVFKELAAENL